MQCFNPFKPLTACIMTRKTSTDKDGGKTSKSEGRDYMKLKNMLEEFVEGDCKDYNDCFDDIIHDITITGVVRMPWKLLKPLLRYKIEKILNELFEDTDSKGRDTCVQVLELLEGFNGPPFTIQRVCELIKDPRKTYRRKDKYIYALKKNLLVVSTQEPDLIWMKVPNLSVLLDPKSSPTIPMPSAPSPDPMNDKDSIMSRDLPSPSWKLSRSPISPRSPRSPRSRTPPPDFESSFAGRNWEGLLEPHPILFRKRTSSSSLRETTTTHSVELHVQLQEADSTVPDQPTTTQETQSGQKRHCSNDDSEDEILKAMLSTSRDSPKSKPSPVNEQNTGTTDNKMDTCSVKKSTNISDTSDMTNDSEMGVAKQSHIIGEDQKEGIVSDMDTN